MQKKCGLWVFAWGHHWAGAKGPRPIPEITSVPIVFIRCGGRMTTGSPRYREDMGSNLPGASLGCLVGLYLANVGIQFSVIHLALYSVTDLREFSYEVVSGYGCLLFTLLMGGTRDQKCIK